MVYGFKLTHNINYLGVKYIILQYHVFTPQLQSSMKIFLYERVILFLSITIASHWELLISRCYFVFYLWTLNFLITVFKYYVPSTCIF